MTKAQMAFWFTANTKLLENRNVRSTFLEINLAVGDAQFVALRMLLTYREFDHLRLALADGTA